MWPWEHLAVGYLLYSLGRRALGRDPPADGDAALLAAATQVPDLVDKPLSWGLGWFPSGYAVGHSAFVALPLGAVALLVAHRMDRPSWGVAVVVGHWSHLVGDVLDPLRYGDPVLPGRVLWPVSDPAPYPTDIGLRRGLVYVREFVAGLSATPPADVLLLYVLLPAATVGVWLLDGKPGLALLPRAVAVVRRHLQ